MPGKEVKDWNMYEALRDQGYTKEQAARITNDNVKNRQKKKKKKRVGK